MAGTDGGGVGAAVVGTPDDLVTAIRQLQEITGGFGVVLGFAHDWANVEATRRSWELVARYVVPELTGATAGIRESQQYLHDNRVELMAGAGKAVLSKILAHEGATKALAATHAAAQEAAAASSPSSNGDATPTLTVDEFRPGPGIPTATD